MKIRIALVALCLCCLGTVRAGDLAITGARLVASPDAMALADATVVVREGRIAAVGPRGEVAVPEGWRVIDADGGVLVAGFWNSHVHLLAPEFLAVPARPAAEVESVLDAMFTRRGFTTVFDIASVGAPALRARIRAGELDGPDILTVDMPFYPEDGTPIYVRDLLDRLQVPSAEVASAGEAATRAARQIADGADGIKLFTGAIVGGETGVVPMDVDIARAVVEVAHRAGKPVFAHPTNAAGLDAALAGGVDVLAHPAPHMGPWDDDATMARLRAAQIAMTPTLTLFDVEGAREGLPAHVVDAMHENAMAQMRALVRAGGTILFGTDVGYIDVLDTRREFELMARAGMGWRDILASLTTAPAARFGQGEDKGRVEPGMRADLVLLGADPARDAGAFADVVLTIKDGRVIHGE